jgi:transposase
MVQSLGKETILGRKMRLWEEGYARKASVPPPTGGPSPPGAPAAGGFKDAEVRVRAQALWLLDQGRSQEETAAILGLNVTTLWRWRRRYVAQGISGLAPGKPLGKAPRLTLQQQGQLKEALTQPPAAFGYNANGWSPRLVADWVRRHLGIRLGEERMRRWLHCLGYRPKRPRVWVQKGASQAEKARFISQVQEQRKGKRLFFPGPDYLPAVAPGYAGLAASGEESPTGGDAGKAGAGGGSPG